MSDNDEYCDICGGICDGIHGVTKIIIEEKQINNLINIIMQYDDEIIKKVILRYYKIKNIPPLNI